jgi:glycosyltransferase involved in cell wall biosynthesis
MPDSVKVVLDGTLFAECEMRGANRDGMMRLTEDITDRLVLNTDLDISFAGTVYIKKYDEYLKRFISSRYPQHAEKIFSKKPPLISNFFKWKELFRTKLAKLPLSPYYKELNDQDIFHSFYYPFPRPVMRNNIKRSITFLDIIPLKLPGYPDDMIYRTKQIVDCISSNYAISISEFSKQDLLNYDKRVNPDKVFVVPLAASSRLFRQNTNREDREKVNKKYGLPDNYFLCIAGSDIRKNIPHIIKSFNQFVLQEKPQDIFLVLAGNGTHNNAILDELRISPEVREKIVIPKSFIDSEDLAAVYSNAVCFFFMSLYEGFGLPALEAMQCGVPVVTSNTTSLPEVVGNAGIMLSPTDEDALSEIMNNIYNDSSLREKYAAAGLARATEFSWQRCADEYASVFKKINSG